MTTQPDHAPSISVTLHAFEPPDNGEDRCAFVYSETPTKVRCNVERSGHKYVPWTDDHAPSASEE